MGKRKLAKFAELNTFSNVFQAPAASLRLPAGAPLSARGVLPAPQVGRADGRSLPAPGRWAAEAFGNARPLVLELGCGRGEYTVGLARRDASRNFIGVDVKGARMWHGARAALAEGLHNAAFLRTDIEFIDRFFAPGEVQELWLTFPDPQMKKQTKRLTATPFLERYRRFLADGGLVHLKTDSQFLYTYTRLLAEENALPVEYLTDDLYHAPLPPAEAGLLDIQTYYEQQWLGRGISIKYIRFRLPRTGELREPDVEIEMDSYRSYNRTKRSAALTSR